MSESSYDPRARLIALPSPALGLRKPLYLYLPPEYAAEPSRRFPTLYLLRGHEREWVNPAEDGSRGGQTVIDAYESLRAAGTIGPMILVFPGLASDDNAVPSMLADLAAPALAGDAPGVGSGRFRHFFFAELIPFIDASYRTIPPARAIAGFSLGGLMAVIAAALRPDLFASVGAFDGTFLYASDAGQSPRLTDGVLANPMFDAALGRPRDRRQIAAINPIVLLRQADPSALRRITWVIQYGPESIEPWGSNFYRGEYLLRYLHTLGIANAAPIAALPDGQHTWQIADRHIAQTLPIHWRALEGRSQKPTV